MIDERELVEQAVRALVRDEPAFDDLIQRRDRKRRNQRIAAGIVGVAVFVAAIWIVTSVGSLDRSDTSVLPGGSGTTGPTEIGPEITPTPTPPVERVGFLGMPPEDAEPTPVDGKLLYHMETSAPDGVKLDIWVHTDGSVVWLRHEGGLDNGSIETDTGYVLQVLTPRGVELLRQEILDTGLFDHDRTFRGDYDEPFDEGVGAFHGPSGLWIDFEGGISVTWYPGHEKLFDGPPTDAQRQTLGRLVDRLADPAAWLPDSAWQDRELRAFVPSTYTVYICCRHRETSQLPAPANELLTEGEENHCVTTEQARAIVEAYEAEGFPLFDRPFIGGSVTYMVLPSEGHTFIPNLSGSC